MKAVVPVGPISIAIDASHYMEAKMETIIASSSMKKALIMTQRAESKT